MTRAERRSALRAERISAGADITGRHVRSSRSLPIFSLLVTAALGSVWVLPATSGVFAQAVPVTEIAAAAYIAPQSLAVDGSYANGLHRDEYSITDPQPVRTSPALPALVGVPDPDTAQGIAYSYLSDYGWDDTEFSCLVALWDRESHWNVYAHNASSGAYGIPQALPGEKMASAGDDWQTNPATQISWGMGYIAGRYGTPCGAWGHSQSVGWY